MTSATTRWVPRVKPAVFVLCLVPAAWLLWDAFTPGSLGVNPIETITHRTGDWALRFLLISLSVTPIRWLTGWQSIIRFRRMWGLFAFFYACLHLSTYVVFDHFFSLAAIVDDVIERKYVTAGMFGFLMLLPLAVTSTRGWIRRLGRRWTTLHRLAYVAAVAGVVHFLWLVKISIFEPMIYGVILALLLGARVAKRYRSALAAGVRS